MSQTSRITIDVPSDLAERMRAKIASGAYASESEMVSEGLKVLAEREESFESWLTEVVAPTYDRMQADPSRALSVDDVRQSLAREASRTKTGS